MSTDDTSLDDALRRWGEEQRQRADPASAPAIADLLSERRRRHSLAGVAASVVVIAALAVGLGFALPGRGHTASPAVPGHPSRSPVATGPITNGTAHRACWQQFVDAGSRFRGFTGVVVLRYTGTTTCRVFEQPQLALVDSHGKVVGPHAPTATLNRVAIVEPGDTVRAGVAIAGVCVTGSPHDGRYSLLVGFRPRPDPRPRVGIVVPVGVLRFTEDVSCPINTGPSPPSAADTTSFHVVGQSRSSTLTELTRIARRVAAADGDRSASAEAVQTTYGRVETTILDDTSRFPSRSASVWVVELHGTFGCASCSRPANADTPPRGHTVVVVLQEPGLSSTDFQLNNRSYDLSMLGTVVPLLP